MRDENGNELSEQEIIKDALNHLAEGLCFAYELQSDEGRAFAFMLDSVVKYGQVIMRGDDVLLAAADYTGYEQEVSERNKLKVIK